MSEKKLYVFAGAESWRCLLMNGKRELRGISFDAGAEEAEECLRGFLRNTYVKSAWIILSSESAVLRFAKLPALKERDLKKAAAFLYEANFPVDKDKYIFSNRVVGKSLDKYRLLLAALPVSTVSGVTGLFRKLGVRIEKLGLFEEAGGLRLSEFSSILVFIKQESTWRVIWMKNSQPFEIWRISSPNDINAMFAELDYGETIDSGLFYSAPEDWIITACGEYGLAVSEAKEPMDIFGTPGSSVNMLPESYKRAVFSRYMPIITCGLFLLLAVSAFSAGLRVEAETAGIRVQNAGLTGEIRSLNDAAASQAAGPPARLEEMSRGYGNILQRLTEQLPYSARVLRVNAADSVIKLSVASDGGEWLQPYIDACQPGLGVNIQIAKISVGNGDMEIDMEIGVLN